MSTGQTDTGSTDTGSTDTGSTDNGSTDASVRLRANDSRAVMGLRRESLIGVGAVSVALVLILVGAPVPVRCLVALPVLVLVPGAAATRLLLGGPARRRSDDDPLVRILLAVVLGILFLLASALVVAVLGRSIDTVSVAVSAAVGSLALIAGAWWRGHGAHESADGSVSTAPGGISTGPVVPRLRRGFGVLLAVGVLVAALVGARAMQTPPVEKYTAITFDDPRMLQPDPMTSGPGAAVTLTWTLRSYGRPLPAGDVSARVTVGAVPASGAHTEVNPALGTDGSGSAGEQSGAVTFSAPAGAGLYQVDLTVTSGGVPYLLETHLEVTP